MSSFAPPPGPPPPTVPEGWKAQYDERYQTWFYINIATGKSQWERPEAPPPSGPPAGPPPNELPAEAVPSDRKQPMASNNPFNPANSTKDNAPSHSLDDDARLAAKLQAEEESRARGQGSDRGAATDYYSDPSPKAKAHPATPRSKGGFLSKLMGKSSSGSSRPPQQQYASYPQQGPPPGGYYGGYPPQQQGYGYPQPGYGGGYGGGYPPQGGYYPQQPPRKSGGMGTAGAAALGVGGGLLGGLLIADAVEDMGDHDNYDNGGGDWGDGGGGGDFGGGDF
ncbi:uncharacterized protein N7458_002630 [Penicillium daleae]|uniref:WW domain-containing protein n=1 Tax=Penicillium daleae TaxID=63821 RepID=A0AAD6G7B2_9EURO|nr:uncharacterized protein N7458_002630 [Penicillium daleae]KAJ5461078.1 hypothetical protein N7458_002630 [Penicillium daleae]